jgi:hypothetical protein
MHLGAHEAAALVLVNLRQTASAQYFIKTSGTINNNPFDLSKTFDGRRDGDDDDMRVSSVAHMTLFLMT